MSMLLGTHRRTPNSDGRLRAAVALLLAVIAHLTAVLALLLLPGLGTPSRLKASPRPVALRSISTDQWAKNRGDARARSAVEPAKKKPEPKKEKPPDGQVVAVAPGNDQPPPDDARFLAERNNRVGKETRAKRQFGNYTNPAPTLSSPNESPLVGPDASDRLLLEGEEGTGTDLATQGRGAGGEAARELPRLAARSELRFREPAETSPDGAAVANRLGSEALAGNSDRFRLTPGGGEEEGERGGSRGRPSPSGLRTLVPSETTMSELFGAPANDDLREVEEGDGTFLNTREWKYASFFNRVKQSVGAQWDPSEKLHVRDPTGTIYGGRDRHTLVHVTLDGSGQLKDIYVEKSSGLDFLDREAVKAFERAAPFPHPPAGLLASDSTVRFTFGFFLDMGGGGLRIRGFRRDD